jgi:hypothetical protein
MAPSLKITLLFWAVHQEVHLGCMTRIIQTNEISLVLGGVFGFLVVSRQFTISPMRFLPLPSKEPRNVTTTVHPTISHNAIGGSDHWQQPLLCCTTSRTYANVKSAGRIPPYHQSILSPTSQPAPPVPRCSIEIHFHCAIRL